MHGLPSGTVTLLFTDIERSTYLLQQLGERYPFVLTEYRQLLLAACRQWSGHEVDKQGDALFMAFACATDAVSAAVEMQRTLAAHTWPNGVTVRVRIGLHTGEPQLSAEGYVGLDVHRAARIMSVGHGGQVLLSQTTRDLVEHDLPPGVSLRDLGAHRLKDLRHPNHLFQLVIAELPADFPPLRTLDTHPNNLPVQLNSLIGRAKEVALVQNLLHSEDIRLLTLTGPGGIGKTRMALQAAAELSDRFADGVFFVNLAPISDPAFVLSRVVQALGLKETGDQPLLDLLKTSLRDKQLLLLLDNFEQIISAAVQVVELLAACPKLKVVVTSRFVLHVRGEQEFAVPPLTVPDPNHSLDLVAMAQYEAVALFIARAHAVKPEFKVTNANARAIAEICVRLDGLPLAIELAAARLKLLPPQALLARLGQRLALLTSASRDVPTRQQTLRNTIAWSYHLLDVVEQRLFQRLSTFVGGCTLKAIEAVCAALDKDSAGQVLDGVASLIDKSLLRQMEEEGEEPRLLMLETIREYGLEMLDASGEQEATRAAYAHYYLALADEAEPYLKSAQQVKWCDRLEREQENVRAVLSWFISQQEVELALRFCAMLSWFWRIRGYWSEGHQWMMRALGLPQALYRTVARAKVLCAVGFLGGVHDNDTVLRLLEESVAIYREHTDEPGLALALSWLGYVRLITDQETSAGRALLEESITLCQRVGERWTLALSLEHLGWSYLWKRNFAQAAAVWEKSIALYKELGDQQGRAETLDGLAALALSQGNITRAKALWNEQLLLSRTLNEKRTIADALQALGRLAAAEGELSQAEAFCQESLSFARDVGYHGGIERAMSSLGQIARCRSDLPQAALWAEKNLALARGPFQLFDAGRCAMERGDLVQATVLFQEGLSLGQKRGDESIIAYFLRGFALLALEQQQPKRAACLLGAAENIEREEDPLLRIDFEYAVEHVRSQLGEQAFAVAWTEGRTMTLEQVLTTQEPVTVAEQNEIQKMKTEKAPTYPTGLTAREVEVLRLVAQGLTDAQVAAQLVVSPRTINFHLTSIYSKIGVSSRSAATRYAVEQHLV